MLEFCAHLEFEMSTLYYSRTTHMRMAKIFKMFTFVIYKSIYTYQTNIIIPARLFPIYLNGGAFVLRTTFRQNITLNIV